MADMYTLDAQTRTVTGKKVGQLRRNNITPAVIYGAKITPIHVQMDTKTLTNTLLKAGGTHIITMNIEGRLQQVITRVVQRDVIRGHILHVDFLAVDATTTINAEVPVHFVGESPAVQMSLGILLQGMSTIQIEALPANLVERIDVDLSGLKAVGDSIHIRDIRVPEGITLTGDPDAMVVRVTITSAAVSEAATDAGTTPSEPEVIEKGKKDDDFED